MYSPEEQNQFCFPESPDETSTLEGKQNQLHSSRLYIKCFAIYLDFP